MPSNAPQSRLHLSSRLSVLLGATREEISQPQTVWLELTLVFPELPYACESDGLSDTVNYAELWRYLQDTASAKSFQLLEHLGYELYHKLKSLLADQTRLVLKVIKTPPAACIDSASFVLDDTA